MHRLLSESLILRRIGKVSGQSCAEVQSGCSHSRASQFGEERVEKAYDAISSQFLPHRFTGCKCDVNPGHFRSFDMDFKDFYKNVDWSEKGYIKPLTRSRLLHLAGGGEMISSLLYLLARKNLITKRLGGLVNRKLEGAIKKKKYSS